MNRSRHNKAGWRWPGWVTVLLLGCALAVAAAAARADTITLTDGTKIEGRAIKQGDNYWVKPDGDARSRLIPADKVQSIQKASPGTPAAQGGGAAPASVAGGTSAEYAATRRRADSAIFAKEAVTVWQEFLDNHPDSPERAPATAELERWKALAANDAEKIRGKWVGGAERQALIDKAAKLGEEAEADLKADRTVAAMEKLRQAVNAYPNDYAANFALGYVWLLTSRYEDAIPYFEQSLRLRPESAGCMNNLAVALWESNQFERSLQLFLQSAEKEDNGALARNLATVSAFTPWNQVSAARQREFKAAAALVMAKYGVKAPGPNEKAGDWYLAKPPKYGPHTAASGSDNRPIGSGSGFVIAEEGLVLTNRHVAGAGEGLTALMPDGSEKPLEVVVIDKEQDLALVRFTDGQKHTALPIAKADVPNEGAQCYVIGYPLGGGLKVTQGIVSGTQPKAKGADVFVDAKVNPGNSGGPLLDKRGQVIGVVTRKTLLAEDVDSYGIAIGAGKIRAFLEKNHAAFTTASDADPSATTTLSPEDLVARAKPATVSIQIYRNKLPPTVAKAAGDSKPLQRFGIVSSTRPAATRPSVASATTAPLAVVDFTRAGANARSPGWGGGAATAGRVVVNLVPAFDPAKDAVAGEWRVDGGKLVCATHAMYPRVAVPYALPEEYDLRVEWAQAEPRGVVFLGLSQGGHAFAFTLDAAAGKASGFEQVDGHSVSDPANNTSFNSAGLTADRRYSVVVQVRRDGARAFVNGEFKASYSTASAFAELSMPASRAGRDPNRCLIGCDDPTVFYKVELVEISGTATALR